MMRPRPEALGRSSSASLMTPSRRTFRARSRRSRGQGRDADQSVGHGCGTGADDGIAASRTIAPERRTASTSETPTATWQGREIAGRELEMAAAGVPGHKDGTGHQTEHATDKCHSRGIHNTKVRTAECPTVRSPTAVRVVPLLFTSSPSTVLPAGATLQCTLVTPAGISKGTHARLLP